MDIDITAGDALGPVQAFYIEVDGVQMVASLAGAKRYVCLGELDGNPWIYHSDNWDDGYEPFTAFEPVENGA